MPVTAPASDRSRTVPANTQVPPAPGSATKFSASSAEIGSAVTLMRRSDTRSSYGAVVRCVCGLRPQRVRRFAPLQGAPAGPPVEQRTSQLGAGPADRGGGGSGGQQRPRSGWHRPANDGGGGQGRRATGRGVHRLGGSGERGAGPGRAHRGVGGI